MAHFQRGSSITIFQELAEATAEGSRAEALFSGLARLACDVLDIKKSLNELKHKVSDISIELGQL